MTKQGKIILGVLALGGLTGLGIYLWNQKKKKDEADKGLTEEEKQAGAGLSQGSNSAPYSSGGLSTYGAKLEQTDTNGVKFKSKGLKTAMWQAMINKKFGTNIKVDGLFGQEMADAIRSNMKLWSLTNCVIVAGQECKLSINDPKWKAELYPLFYSNPATAAQTIKYLTNPATFSEAFKNFGTFKENGIDPTKASSFYNLLK